MADAVPVDRLVLLRRAKDVIDGGYAGPLDLRTIAASAHYSPYHFVRSFREAYGETPGRYLTRRRVERAKDLLRSAELSVTEVCHRVGFSSLGSFSARFKEQVGESPSAYRDRVRTAGWDAIPDCFVVMWSAHRAAQSRRSAGAPGGRSVEGGATDELEDT